MPKKNSLGQINQRIEQTYAQISRFLKRVKPADSRYEQESERLFKKLHTQQGKAAKFIGRNFYETRIRLRGINHHLKQAEKLLKRYE